GPEPGHQGTHPRRLFLRKLAARGRTPGIERSIPCTTQGSPSHSTGTSFLPQPNPRSFPTDGSGPDPSNTSSTTILAALPSSLNTTRCCRNQWTSLRRNLFLPVCRGSPSPNIATGHRRRRCESSCFRVIPPTTS